jgi:hypothetical protein
MIHTVRRRHRDGRRPAAVAGGRRRRAGATPPPPGCSGPRHCGMALEFGLKCSPRAVAARRPSLPSRDRRPGPPATGGGSESRASVPPSVGGLLHQTQSSTSIKPRAAPPSNPEQHLHQTQSSSSIKPRAAPLLSNPEQHLYQTQSSTSIKPRAAPPSNPEQHLLPRPAGGARGLARGRGRRGPALRRGRVRPSGAPARQQQRHDGICRSSSTALIGP